MSFVPHQVGNTLWYEIAHKMYPDKLACFREAISNSLDEGSTKVILEIAKDKITIEDFGAGIDDMDKFIKVGHDGKLQRQNQRDTIGQKGMGKLSLLALGDEVIFLSNNGKVGYKFTMVEGGQYRDTPSGATDYLGHKGTLIMIPKPKQAYDIDKVRAFLKKAFSLQVAMGKEILINGEKLTATKSIDSEEKFILALKGGNKVTGNIILSEKNYGSLAVYVQHVFICNMLIDPERKFSGWVNCNALIPTASRSDIFEDDEGHKEEFVRQMMKYVKRFPKITDAKQSTHLNTEQENFMDKILKELHMDFRGEVLTAIGTAKSMDAQSIDFKEGPEEQQIREAIKQQEKSQKETKRDKKNQSGVIWRNAELGNDKPPYMFSYPNIVIRNTTNDLYKYSTKINSSLGPARVRYLQFMARVLCYMNPQKNYWSPTEWLAKADEYYLVCLKSAGYIEN